MSNAVVHLVGAGPGAADLLTVRALRIIEQAEVVCYDRLVSDEIMDLLPLNCDRIYVGKDPEADSRVRQDRVHTLLIGHALAGKRVVRLKGGDPFVFGRGGEELLKLRSAGIHVEIVPGISSCIAGPQAAWIPVTHRGMAASFGVFAGRSGDGIDQGGVDWLAAARMRTAVFLMGVARLGMIVEKLVEHGRSMETPVAVISNATRQDQKVYSGTLANIQEVAAQACSPATIIVGEVVNVREMALEAEMEALTACAV